jgi:hypothetical protein
MTRRNRFNNPFLALADREKALRRRSELIRDRLGIELNPYAQRRLEVAENELVDTSNRPLSEQAWAETFTTIANNTDDYTIFTRPYIRNTTTQTITTTSSTSFRIPYNLYGTTSEEFEKIKKETKEQALAHREKQEREKLNMELKRQLRAKYKDWVQGNREATGPELNSNYFNFSIFQSKKSLEIQLLKAIAEKAHYQTKTTEYRPVDNCVYLYGRRIAKLNEDFEITKVCQPIDFATKRINLFRHRLRQLGLRCLYYNGDTRLYLGDNYISMVPGTVYSIPYAFRKLCLPRAWMEKVKVELIPVQPFLPLEDARNPFFANSAIELEQFAYRHSNYSCKVIVILDGNNVRLRVSAEADIGEEPEILHRDISIHVGEWHSLGAMHHVEALKKQLNTTLGLKAWKREQYRRTIMGTDLYQRMFIGPTVP